MVELKGDNKERQYWLVSRLVATNFVENEDDLPEVDHKDGNPMNNDHTNLRWCDHSNNLGNARKRRSASSRFKGVSWVKPLRKWVAYFKRECLGYFDSEEEAAQAYNKRATEVFGEFAKLNILL